MDDEEIFLKKMESIRNMIERAKLFDNARYEYKADNPDDQREWEEWLEKVKNSQTVHVTYV